MGRPWVRALALSMLAPLGAVAAEAPPRPAPEALSPGVPVARGLAAGGADAFRVTLAGGQVWRVEVAQHGIDTVLIVDASGAAPVRIDSPGGREAQESWVLRPKVATDVTLTVASEEAGAPAGRYTLRLDALPASTSDERQRAAAEIAIGEAHRFFALDPRDLDAGLLRLADARAILRALGDRRGEARVSTSIGGLHDQAQAPRQAVEAYLEALRLWRRLGDEPASAMVLERLGVAHRRLGEHPRAVTLLREALALRQRLGQRSRAVVTHNQLCLAQQRSGQFRQAATCYESALGAARATGDLALEARLVNNLGGVYQNLGEPARALAAFEDALRLRRALGDTLGAGTAYNNRGFYRCSLGDFEDGLRDYGLALAIFEAEDNRYWQARTRNNIGFAFLGLGDASRARAHLLRALPLRRAVGDRSGEAVTLRNLGRAHAALGEPGKAVAYWRKALAIGLARGDRRGVVTARKLLGAHLASQGDVAAAADVLTQALDGARAMGNRQEEAELSTLASDVAHRSGDWAGAQSLARHALALHASAGDPLGQVAARLAWLRAARGAEAFDTAQTQLTHALATLESMVGRLTLPDRRARFLASQHAAFEEGIAYWMDRHGRAPDAGYDREALVLTEQGRARALLLQIGSRAAVDAIEDPRQAARLGEARRRVAAKSRRQLHILAGAHTGAEALAAQQELEDARRTFEDLHAPHAHRASRGTASDRAADVRGVARDLAGMRAVLDDQTALLTYALGEEASFLWWLTQDELAVHVLPARVELERLAHTAHAEVGSIQRRRGPPTRSLTALGDALLGPVADRLPDRRRLAVVADGALHLVPFAALPMPATGAPLVTTHEIVHLPSASVLATLRAVPRPAAPKTLAIVADPAFLGSGGEDTAGGVPAGGAPAMRAPSTWVDLERLPPLPHTRREAELLAALRPDEDRLLLRGVDASRERVLAGALRGYRMVHFATHGIVQPGVPELTGLVLATRDAEGAVRDGFLGLDDVRRLALTAELVVLSACRTAVGAPLRGEGPMGLARAFMATGVPRVVASLWPVPDEATATLMARFYRGVLVEGLAPPVALGAAQRAVRDQRRFRDPYYWAAFTFQGEWRPLPSPPLPPAPVSPSP